MSGYRPVDLETVSFNEPEIEYPGSRESLADALMDLESYPVAFAESVLSAHEVRDVSTKLVEAMDLDKRGNISATRAANFRRAGLGGNMLGGIPAGSSFKKKTSAAAVLNHIAPEFEDELGLGVITEVRETLLARLGQSEPVPAEITEAIMQGFAAITFRKPSWVSGSVMGPVHIDAARALVYLDEFETKLPGDRGSVVFNPEVPVKTEGRRGGIEILTSRSLIKPERNTVKIPAQTSEQSPNRILRFLGRTGGYRAIHLDPQASSLVGTSQGHLYESSPGDMFFSLEQDSVRGVGMKHRSIFTDDTTRLIIGFVAPKKSG